MPPRQRKPDTRPGDRHDPEAQKNVSARIDRADFDQLETARKAQGISRRQAVITAIREWAGRHDSDASTKEQNQ